MKTIIWDTYRVSKYKYWIRTWYQLTHKVQVEIGKGKEKWYRDISTTKSIQYSQMPGGYFRFQSYRYLMCCIEQHGLYHFKGLKSDREMQHFCPNLESQVRIPRCISHGSAVYCLGNLCLLIKSGMIIFYKVVLLNSKQKTTIKRLYLCSVS